MTTLDGERGDVAVLVPAAGAGQRLGPGAPKALRSLVGEPLLAHAARRLVAAGSVGALVVAAPPGHEEGVRELLAAAVPGHPVMVVTGGAERQHSVAAALAAAPADFDIILIHDAARALVPVSLVEDVAAAVRSGHDAVIPVLPVTDTITQVDLAGGVVSHTDRSRLRAVQTPQGFRRAVLVAAHAAARVPVLAGAHPPAAATAPVTDDAGLVLRIGHRVQTVPGSVQAMKITTLADFQLAATWL